MSTEQQLAVEKKLQESLEPIHLVRRPRPSKDSTELS